jgi:capsular exopolysaccharide synthesis family protein
MSRFFEAIKNQKLVGFSELFAEDDKLSGKPAERREEYEAPPAAVLPWSTECVPFQRLRVSALSPVFPFEEGHLIAADQYRIIRTKILHSSVKSQLILVSSPSSGDGKTITAINLAASFALKEDARVLLVDADFRRPRISEVLGIGGGKRLEHVLDGLVELPSAVVRAEEIPNLFVLCAGNGTENASELLDSEKWHAVIKQIRSHFTNVVFDAPPIATLADYELLQLACDGVVVVVRPDHTERAGCLKALQTIPGNKLLGVVLNAVEDWWLWKPPNYGHYPKPFPEQPRSDAPQNEKSDRGNSPICDIET